MTTFIAAYDTESPNCLAALKPIVALHEKYEMPATFFLVARLLDGPQADEYKAMLADHPLFEIASHTYTHMLVRQVRLSPPPGPAEQYEHELIDSKRRIEDVLGATVTGFRTPWGSCEGLRGKTDLLDLLDRGGYRYSSSLAWGPDDTMPALLVDPFTYADDGYPGILEIPPCGWQENVMKSEPPWSPKALQLFPHPVPEAMLSRLVETPEEEFAVHRVFIDKGADEDAPCVSLIWHPWSLHRFDPEMRMVDMTFRYVRERELPTSTFAEFAETL